ncbi:MAG: hypothetical protein Q7U04_05895 [Bacteriovorax sp.]|nr:hypothetical protein [Bacteriovorax sp.]
MLVVSKSFIEALNLNKWLRRTDNTNMRIQILALASLLISSCSTPKSLFQGGRATANEKSCTALVKHLFSSIEIDSGLPYTAEEVSSWIAKFKLVSADFNISDTPQVKIHNQGKGTFFSASENTIYIQYVANGKKIYQTLGHEYGHSVFHEFLKKNKNFDIEEAIAVLQKNDERQSELFSKKLMGETLSVSEVKELAKLDTNLERRIFFVQILKGMDELFADTFDIVAFKNPRTMSEVLLVDLKKPLISIRDFKPTKIKDSMKEWDLLLSQKKYNQYDLMAPVRWQIGELVKLADLDLLHQQALVWKIAELYSSELMLIVNKGDIAELPKFVEGMDSLDNVSSFIKKFNSRFNKNISDNLK